jgi:hypothetical protein
MSRLLRRLGTETWLICHRVVRWAAGAGGVYPLCSHPIPLYGPQATAKLFPCTAGSSHPCTGKLPGPSLSALPPSQVFLFSSVLGNQVYDGVYHKTSFLPAGVIESAKHAWVALFIVR